MFMQNHFFSVDEYFNLKSIILLEPDCSKVSVEYADKFMILKKRLLFTNQIKETTAKELRHLCIPPHVEHKVSKKIYQVIVIGFSLPVLMMVDKLS